VRYWTAALLFVTLPPAVFYWYLIHPFAGYWRRLGPWPTYLVITPLALAGYWGLWTIKDPFLTVEYGFDPLLTALGAALYAVAVALEIKRSRHLKLSILTGLPELRRDAGPGKLLDEGIYARIRHPRYVAITLGIGGFCLFANYQGLYLMWVAMVPALYLLVLMEERELRERFGHAYVEYSRQVPRFLPRRAKR